MNWFFYALATPALYSITNFIDKFIIEKKMRQPLVLVTFGNFLVGILGIVIGLIHGFEKLEPIQLVLILFAGIILTFYLVPYFKALKTDETSRIVPLFQLTPVFVLIMSFVFLKESLALKQLVGFVFILFSGFLLATEKIEGKLFKPRQPLWYMLLCVFLYALVAIIFRFVVKNIDFWTTLSYEYIGCGIGSLLLFLLIKNQPDFWHEAYKFKSIFRLVLINNALAITAQMSESFAISLVPVVFVSIVGGTQPLFLLTYGLLLSYFFPHIIKEDISKSVVGLKLGTIVLIFIGLYFIYF